MHDWAAPFIASALFVFLAPGLVFQMPGKESTVGFMNMKTSVISMLLHTVLYGLLLILFLVVLDIHINKASHKTRSKYHMKTDIIFHVLKEGTKAKQH
ncbi:hypothetical protein L6452_44675 [Arctium lappa]|uniref:Uncharacterized protein n=1 Tax=Arctium lappa TaxID=4217 RepID=A0ACB8XFR5_ARCLA|nr:hypothetical protein L6452_44675 [Arctium lappa]